jgi:hypothetical protein
MSGFEIAGVLIGCAALLPFCKKGYRRVKREWRHWRNARNQRLQVTEIQASEILKLENEILRTDGAVMRRCKELTEKFGRRFTSGDGELRKEVFLRIDGSPCLIAGVSRRPAQRGWRKRKALT